MKYITRTNELCHYKTVNVIWRRFGTFRTSEEFRVAEPSNLDLTSTIVRDTLG